MTMTSLAWSIEIKLIFFLFFSVVLCSELPSCRVIKRDRQHVCPNYCYYIPASENIFCEDLNQMLATPYICSSNVRCNITFTNNDVSILRTNSFVKLTSLQAIFLNNSKIEVIQSKTFSGLSNLTSVHLENNNVTHLIKGSFSSLPWLKFLNLSNNAIEQIDVDSFQDSNLMETLDLSHNNLNELNTEVLQPLYHVRILNMSHNMLSEFDQNFCYHLNFLEYLILDNNRIDLLPNCSENSNIEVLSLAENSLTFLNESLFPKALKSLILRHNKLTTINSNAFVNLKTLQFLDISGNGLTGIPFELFENMANLIILDISQNEINNLEYGIFYGLSNLKILNMSYNNLDKLESHVFLPLVNLIRIDISHNYIENFDIEFLLSYSHNLKMLNIGGNNFSCPGLANMILYAKTKNISIPHTITLSGQCTDKLKENNSVTFSNNSTNFLSTYFERDFKNSAFFKFFKNFNYSTQGNEFKSYSRETVQIQKELARNLSEDIHNLVRTENQFLQKFLEQFSKQINGGKTIKPIVTNDGVDNTKIENLQKFFEEFEASMNEKMSKFGDNNSLQSSALKKEDNRMDNLINQMDQLKLFFLLCTLVFIAFCAVKLTKYFKPTFNFNQRNRHESREIPFVQEYNTQDI